MQTSSDKKNWESGIRITWVSLIINIFLALAKCTIGFLANSLALLGDGLHSFLDLTTDLMAIFGIKMSTKPQDVDHHYGHHKFSSLSTLFIATFLLIFCFGLIFSSVTELLTEQGPSPSLWALPIVIISVIAKEILYWKTLATAKKLKSRVLMANAFHHRWDSFSSILVLIALGAIMLGGPDWRFIDKVAGLLMGGHFGIQSLKLFKQACDDLLDKAPEIPIIHDLTEHVLPTPGAIGYHKFRARRIGDMIEVDLHLQVNPNITVEEGHDIAARVKKNILSTHSEVIDVLIHIEPALPDHLKEKGISQITE